MKNPLERFNDTLSGKGPSSFFWESIGYMRATIERWHGQGLPKEMQGGQWDKSFYDYFGLDWVNFFPLKCHYLPAFEETILEDEGNTEVVIDSNGIVLRRSKASLSMPQFLKYPVGDMKSYEKILFRRNAASPERIEKDIEQWEKQAKVLRAPIAVFIYGFFAIVRELMGFEEGLVAFYDNPALIKRILGDHCDFCIELVRRAATSVKTKIDFCYLWEDMSYKNGMLISPALFKEFIVPVASRFIRAIKDFNVGTVIVDSDGNVNELIPLYMECGVKGFLPFEVQAGMDIREIRKQYPELIIIGGIDKLAIAKGNDCLKNEMLEKVGPMIRQGRYIPSLDHQAHPEMPLYNYRQYISMTKNMMS